MDQHFKTLTSFLMELGVDRVGHTNKSYLAHLVGVYRDMQAGGCTADVCRAAARLFRARPTLAVLGPAERVPPLADIVEKLAA